MQYEHKIVASILYDMFCIPDCLNSDYFTNVYEKNPPPFDELVGFEKERWMEKAKTLLTYRDFEGCFNR